MLYAVIRVRGRTGILPTIKHTMELLNLSRINHCVLLSKTPQNEGMLRTCKDYVTWGEIDIETLSKLLEKRARILGNKRITQAYFKEKGYSDFGSLAKDLYEGKITLKELGLKKVFRLNPPRNGYKETKKPYPRGALGNRGKDINTLLGRMM